VPANRSDVLVSTQVEYDASGAGSGFIIEQAITQTGSGIVDTASVSLQDETNVNIHRDYLATGVGGTTVTFDVEAKWTTSGTGTVTAGNVTVIVYTLFT